MQPRSTTNHSEITLGAFSSATRQTRLDAFKNYIQPMRELDTRQDIVRGFSPAWFTASMGTGMACTLLYNFPYYWAPLQYIAWGIGVLNILLFVTFLVLFIWRIVQYRDFYHILLHPQLSMPLGAIPMALVVIVVSLVTVGAQYETEWLPVLALVLWIIGVVFSLLSFLIIPFLVTSHQRHILTKVNATLLLPVVPTVVAATGGAVVASVHSGSTAVAVVLISYILWAMGVGVAMMLIVLYLVRLVLYKLPPKETIASAFIPLGPLGQSSYCIQLLGTQAQRLFPQALPQIPQLGEVLNVLGFLLGLFIWALAVWWITHGIYAVVYTRIQGPVPFNLGWWALIFPTGTFATSSYGLWLSTGYTFFRVLTAAVSVGIVLLWIVVIINTFRYAFSSP
ncbi:Plasma membrane sulfite pump involved in sulfite metabolism [Coemansia sp. RSA 552]|nr:Plasma membrane sulfite pump involved in sulfite metabolism [Coemansia sp. RSA 552]